jgi:chromosome partitioning protein
VVITIASYKGGQGKSTTAIHLAAHFQEQAPTLVVDSDPNKTCLKWAEHNTTRNFGVASQDQAAKEILSGKYKVVINDTPARPESLDLKGMIDGSDIVIIPINPDIFSLRTLEDAASQFRALEAHAIRVLLTNVPPAPQKDGEMARAALEQIGYPMFNHEIRRSKAFLHAQVRSCFVQDVREDSRSYAAWSDYEGVGEEIEKLVRSFVEHKGTPESKPVRSAHETQLRHAEAGN